MSERSPEEIASIEKEAKEQRKQEYIALAKELHESGEIFPFPGINPERYALLKKDEEEFPGFTTPIDELIERFEAGGMKVVFGKNPESGNVFILPFDSNDIESDSLLPKHLLVTEAMDPRLQRLVELDLG